MHRKYLVIIDNDTDFEYRLRNILNDLDVLLEYDLYSVGIRDENTENVVNGCTEAIGRLLSEGCSIELIMVDITLQNRGEVTADRVGVRVARAISAFWPTLPIVGMTRFIKSYRLLSEITFEPSFQGVVLKPYIESKEFSKTDFRGIIEMAKRRIKGLSRDTEN